MKNNLRTFVTLRRQLTEERLHIESRLREINEALGDLPASSSSSGQPQAPSSPTQSSAGANRGLTGRAGARAGAGQSLREHVLAVLQAGPKTKEDVLSAVLSRGYKFSTSNPLNSLGVILYGKNPRFHRANGMFSLTGSPSASSAMAQRGNTRGGKRTMSAAGRKAIAAAAKKRWAAARASGRNRL